MSVIKTDQWLQKYYDNPVELCKQIKKYFHGAGADDIYEHLTSHGMYRHPQADRDALISTLKEKGIWQIIKTENKKLQSSWDGPSVPIFILPADPHNKKLIKDTGGKSGLAFHDKLFLFISEKNTADEIRALFTHEYNHVCRLAKLSKKEADFTLLDTIILEGIAEYSVSKRVGKQYVAPWINYYSKSDLEKIWEELILPNKSLSRRHPKHQKILYGIGFYPKMAGYAIGYDLVKKFMQTKQLTVTALLKTPSETIADTYTKQGSHK